jgi:hypothetical protein
MTSIEPSHAPHISRRMHIKHVHYVLATNAGHQFIKFIKYTLLTTAPKLQAGLICMYYTRPKTCTNYGEYLPTI